MVPSRLAFVQEFDRQIASAALKEWFDSQRRLESALDDFADPASLRQFLQSPDMEAAKPELWRVLIRALHREETPEALLFVLGLLEPAIGALADQYDRGILDPEVLWQETVTCAIQALRNPRLHRRPEVLAGLVRDTYKRLCRWLRTEFSGRNLEMPLIELAYEPRPKDCLPRGDDDLLLADWCQRAGISPSDTALLTETRLRGKRLSIFAAARSPLYDRLRRRRRAAEHRLEAWLQRRNSASR